MSQIPGSGLARSRGPHHALLFGTSVSTSCANGYCEQVAVRLIKRGTPGGRRHHVKARSAHQRSPISATAVSLATSVGRKRNCPAAKLGQRYTRHTNLC
jgi:hypothetical protein